MSIPSTDDDCDTSMAGQVTTLPRKHEMVIGRRPKRNPEHIHSRLMHGEVTQEYVESVTRLMQLVRQPLTASDTAVLDREIQNWEKSRLLRLPREILDQIFDYVNPGTPVRICESLSEHMAARFMKPYRAGKKRLYDIPYIMLETPSVNGGRARVPASQRNKNLPIHFRMTKEITPVWRVCRHLYKCNIDALYRQNSFQLSYGKMCFQYLNQLPHLSDIRELVIQFYARSKPSVSPLLYNLGMMRRMTGLRRLKLWGNYNKEFSDWIVERVKRALPNQKILIIWANIDDSRNISWDLDYRFGGRYFGNWDRLVPEAMLVEGPF